MNKPVELSLPGAKSPSLKVSSFNSDNYFNELNRYNHFAVILMQSAKGEVTADASHYCFDGNSLLTFSLYQPFKIKCGNVCSGLIVEFHPDFFCLHKHRAEVSCNGILFNNIYTSPITTLTIDEALELSSLINDMISELQRKEADTEMLLSFLRILLIKASRIKVNQTDEAPGVSKQLPDVLVALQSAIEDNFRSMHKAADYAKLIYISQDSLNRICKDHFNKTLLHVITDRIVLEAKRELYLTNKPVKTIAYDIGFTDEFHFSRYFKNNVHVSPQMFRDTVGVGRAVNE